MTFAFRGGGGFSIAIKVFFYFFLFKNHLHIITPWLGIHVVGWKWLSYISTLRLNAHKKKFLKADCKAGVNKKPKKFKTVWHGFWGILKLSGRVNQASLKLSASFSISVCWTYKSDYMGNRTMTVPNCCRISNQKILRLFSMHIFSKLKNLDVYTLFNTSIV